MNYLQKLTANIKRGLVIWLLGQLGISRSMIDAEVRQSEREQRAMELARHSCGFAYGPVGNGYNQETEIPWIPLVSDAPERWRTVGFIYFVQKGRKAVKIGFSTQPEQRLSSLQTGSSEKLSLVAKLPGTFSDEQKLHQRFKQYRLSGEWFTLSQEISDFITEVQAATADQANG